MAAPSVRIVRRPRGAAVVPRGRSLVAASQPIPNPAKAFRSIMGGSVRSDWQNDAWDMLDAVGELRYYVGWRASSASRVRLIASEIDETTGLPTGGLTEDDDGNLSGEQQRVAEIVKSIAGGPLGQAQLLKRGVEHLTVPGETWIAILISDKPDPITGKPQPATWLAVSRDEVKAASPRETSIELPNGDKHVFVEGRDGIIRVWNPRARRAKEADSPVRAAMDSLKEIVRTTKTIANASKSRLIGNGVVFVPHEMSLPTMNAPTSADKPGAPVTQQGQAAVQALQELLFQVAQTAYDDEDSMAALIPMFAGVPADLISKVSHFKFDNTVTEVALKTRNEAIGRLAMALDVSPERLMGLGSNSNHWSAWQVADEDVQLHIVPPVETICNAITDQVLKTVLAREGIDPTKYVLWYDVSALTADPDPAESAKEAFDRGAITAEALVRMLGLADDTVYDFSSPEGWEQWATDKISEDPTLIDKLQPLISALNGVEFPQTQVALPPGQNDPNAADEGDPESEPDTEDTADEEPSGQARVLTEREAAAVEFSVSRALDLAGKRRRTRSLSYELRQLPARELIRRLPPARDEEVPGLIRGWDSVLSEPAVRNLGLDEHVVRAAVRKIVTQELTRTIDAEVS